MKEIPEMDRKSLVDCLNVKPEGSGNLAIRVAVDTELAKLFSALNVWGYDLNLRMPRYTLPDIRDKLAFASVNVPAEDFIKQRLRVNLEYNDHYTFRKVIRPFKEDLYVLKNHRAFREGGEQGDY